MNQQYEFLEYDKTLPIHTSLHSVDTISPHWHQELEILLILEGSIYVMLHNATKRVGKGELIVISPNVIHFTQQTQESNLVYALQINCEAFYLGKNINQHGGLQFACCGGRQTHPQIASIRKNMCAIMLELLYKQDGYIQIAASYVQMILGTLTRYFRSENGKNLTVPAGKKGDRIQRILHYVDEHYSEHLSLNDIAAREYLSLNYLSSFFSKQLGMSFTDYVNTVRLRAFISLMESDPTASLGQISEKCGFSSPQYAARLFTETYHTTPGKYRNELETKEAIRLQAIRAKKSENYVAVYTPLDLSGVLKYLMQESEPKEQIKSATLAGEDRTIDCAGPAAGAYYRSALKLTTIGRANDGLLQPVQQCLRALREEIGFTHLRFHGLLSDDMMILCTNISGGVEYSWRMVDLLLDFICSIGMHPFLELTYMPTLLASGSKTVFHWKGNITQPSSLDMWCALVKELVTHCVLRYGAQEVSQWYFEIWNEPDYAGISWDGTESDFFYFYERTAKAVREAFPQARVCGPSVAPLGIASQKWIGPFLNHCSKTEAPLDAVSFHAYPEIITSSNLQASLVEAVYPSAGHELKCPLMGQDYVRALIEAVRGQLKNHSALPLVITEWNLTMAARNPINDSMFAATALLYDALSCDGEDIIMGHWTATDYMEEQVPLPASEFHGGFGLTTINGLRKPAYWAMWALSRLKGEIIERLPNGIVMRSNRQYTLLAYYHPELKTAYSMQYSRSLVSEALRQGEILEFCWTLKGVEGKWRAKRYHYQGYECAPQLLMREMNLHEPLSKEDIRYLDGRAQPTRLEETMIAGQGEGLRITFRLHLFEFELIDLFML